jgi:hypothetical protein
LYRWIVNRVSFAVPEAKTRLAAVLAAVAFFSLQSPDEAEARSHCGHGMIYRVSLGQCVSARSRAARGFHRRTGGLSGRYHHAKRQRIFSRRHGRHRIASPVATEPDELPDEVLTSPKIQERVERAVKSDRLPSATEPEPSIELPVGITGSLLMRTPAPKSFEWLSPSHQHPLGGF